MVPKADKLRLKKLLSDAVLLLCRNGLPFQTKFSIEALIGITLDEDDVVLVSFKEAISVDGKPEKSPLFMDDTRDRNALMPIPLSNETFGDNGHYDNQGLEANVEEMASNDEKRPIIRDQDQSNHRQALQMSPVCSKRKRRRLSAQGERRRLDRESFGDLSLNPDQNAAEEEYFEPITEEHLVDLQQISKGLDSSRRRTNVKIEDGDNQDGDCIFVKSELPDCPDNNGVTRSGDDNWHFQNASFSDLNYDDGDQNFAMTACSTAGYFPQRCKSSPKPSSAQKSRNSTFTNLSSKSTPLKIQSVPSSASASQPAVEVITR